MGLKKQANVATKVVSKNLCCGCGVCAAICPVKGCITIQFDKNLEYESVVNYDVCTNCGICLRVCPDDSEANGRVQRVFGKNHPNTRKNEFLGPFLACYVGYVANLEDRHASASGGVLTAILEELLTTKKIDGVALVGSSDYQTTGKFFEAVLVDSVAKIRQNRGSKYYPIEHSGILKKIESKDGYYAVVALPCVTLGIRKAQLYNNKLRKNIHYIFSLVCGHSVSAAYTNYLLETSGIESSSVVRLNYRDKERISNALDYNLAVKYLDKQGLKTKRFSFQSSNVGKTFCSYMFTMNKCLYCTDFAGELSDASFADAWLPEYIQDVNGTSLVIVRNAEIKSLVERMVMEGRLKLSPVPSETVIKAEWGPLYFKKELVKGRIFIQKLLHRDFPSYEVNWQGTTILEALHKNWRILLNQHLSKWLYRHGLLQVLRTNPFLRLTSFIDPFGLVNSIVQLITMSKRNKQLKT